MHLWIITWCHVFKQQNWACILHFRKHANTQCWSQSKFWVVGVCLCQNLTGDGSVRLLVLPIIHTNILEVLSALITVWVLMSTHTHIVFSWRKYCYTIWCVSLRTVSMVGLCWHCVCTLCNTVYAAAWFSMLLCYRGSFLKPCLPGHLYLKPVWDSREPTGNCRTITNWSFHSTKEANNIYLIGCVLIR